LPHKKNVVLYLDSELGKKTRELGFNLSKTCENHFKQLITQFSAVNSADNCGDTVMGGSPGEIRTLVSGSRARHAWPLHHRASNIQNLSLLINLIGFSHRESLFCLSLVDMEGGIKRFIY
jgi:hypothetical protein